MIYIASIQIEQVHISLTTVKKLIHHSLNEECESQK